MKKFKESVASSGSGASTSSGDTMESLLKLKKLLDQGLITQEEFDEKRKSLVDKM